MISDNCLLQNAFWPFGLRRTGHYWNGLKPQREPYWHRLAVGQFIGFRPSTIGKGGSWVARLYDPDTRSNKFRSLGDYGSLPLNERFTVARKAAAEWFEHVGAGGSTKPVSIREACERYAEGRPEAARRFEQYVYNDPIAKLTLDKLKKQHVLAFRKRLESTPALVSRRKHGEQVTRPRSAATVNRDMVPLRAALNAAKDTGLIATDTAWTSALRPNKGADRRRNLYLDRDERRALIENLPPDCAAFVRGLSLLPLRPGALASLKVKDFDLRRNELVISKDKDGHERKILIPAETAGLLKEQARGKLPAASLFTRANGNSWNKDAWKKPIKSAAAASGLPSGTSAYTLRHSAITDLVTGGLDLLTVAQLSGTSVAMIERHYGHLQRHRAAEALSTLVL